MVISFVAKEDEAPKPPRAWKNSAEYGRQNAVVPPLLLPRMKKLSRDGD